MEPIKPKFADEDAHFIMYHCTKIRARKLPHGFHVLRFTDREWKIMNLLPSFGLSKMW